MKQKDKQFSFILGGAEQFNRLIKKALFGVLLLSLILVPVADVLADSIYQKQTELNQIQNSIDNYQSKLEQTEAEINSLEDQISNFNNRISQAELEIKRTNVKIDKTNLEIADTRKKIKKNNKKLNEQEEILGQAIKYMYEEGETPFIETLFSSDTFSQILDRTEYLNTAEMKVEKAIGQIEAIKEELVEQKKGLKNKKKDLVNLRNEHQERAVALNSQKRVRDNMISETRGKERIYEQKLSSLTAKRLAISSWLNEQIYSGGTGGYPFSSVSPCPVYENDGHSYYKGQCVSYVYWKRASIGKPVGEHWGSAYKWKYNAQVAGYSVDQNPQAGDVMWFPAGQVGSVGHVAYVESVSSSHITLSEYNYGYDCRYNKRTIPKSTVYYYGAYFIH